MGSGHGPALPGARGHRQAADQSLQGGRSTIAVEYGPAEGGVRGVAFVDGVFVLQQGSFVVFKWKSQPNKNNTLHL